MKRRVRVVQLICGFLVGDFGGGAELFGIRIAESLDPALFEVAVCNLWFCDTPVERQWHRKLAKQGISIMYGAPFRQQIRPALATAFAGCHRHLRAYQPDIINSHVEYADLVGLASKLSGVGGQLVRTGHNANEWSNKPWIRRFTHSLYPFVCDAEVGVAPGIVDQLNQRWSAKLARKQARFIHNGVDADVVLGQRTGKNVRAEQGIPPDAPLFGMVGRLMEQKGIPYLIQAMPHVLTRLPNAYLLIVGKGHLEPELRALVAKLGLDDRIKLLGGRNDAIDIIAALDVFVLPSLWEGLPTVLLEAMIVGTPVAATDIPGNRDLILDGQTGVLVAPHSPQALAEAMFSQYNERCRAQEMAACARRHANQFSIRSAAQQYTELYLQLVRHPERT